MIPQLNQGIKALNALIKKTKLLMEENTNNYKKEREESL